MTATTDSRTGRLDGLPTLLICLGLFVGGFLLRGLLSEPAPQTTDATSGTHWTCSMHPHIREDQPGPCPICGMDLVSVAGPAAPAKQYACSMFCLPPLPEPGKCPECGMDMVEVDSGEPGPAVDDPYAPLALTLSSLRERARVEVAAVERRLVSMPIRMVGKIQYDETRLRSITAWVPGRLDRLYVDYTGVPVQAGDHLVRLFSPELQSAQAELLEALRSGDGTVRGATDWVEAIRDKFRLWGMTAAQIAEIETRGTASDHMTIHAPISGIVVEKHAVEGMYVDTGTHIYTIADLSRVWVKLDAYESDLAWLRYGQAVTFETEAYPGESFAGNITFIDPVLNSDTRTVKVRVNVDNGDGRLKPQMFVRAVVHSEVAAQGHGLDPALAGKWISPMHPEVIKDGPGSCDVCGMALIPIEDFLRVQSSDAEVPLVIPASAPLITGQRAVVYLEDPQHPGRFIGREIQLGPRAGDHYIVKSGLMEGEQVVVRGNFRIDSAMQIRARPSMMSPSKEVPSPSKEAGHDH